MKYKTKSELEGEIDKLIREKGVLNKVIEGQTVELCDLRDKSMDRMTGDKAEIERAATIRRALEAETHGLRQELAQAQSALYTLINKLPETL